MKLLLLILLSLALFLPAPAADTPLSNPAVGTKDATGELVIHVYTFDPNSPRPVHLSTEYGIMMFRALDGWCRFVLANKSTESVREFTSYDEYLEALSEIPKGSTLNIYDRCQMPRFYDFYPVHQELYRKFSRDCRKLGLKLAKEPQITCTCEDLKSK